MLSHLEKARLAEHYVSLYLELFQVVEVILQLETLLAL